MKKELQALARKHGYLARKKVKRLEVITKLFRTRNLTLEDRKFLMLKASLESKKIDYHLRQARILGLAINNMKH